MSCGKTESVCPPVRASGADRYIIIECRNDVARDELNLPCVIISMGMTSRSP